MGKGSKKTTIGYKYYMGLHMGLCRGPIDAIRQIRVGNKVAWTGKITSNQTLQISQPKLFGGELQEGGIDGTLHVMFGQRDQPRNDALAAMLGGLVSAFRGVVTTFFDGYVCAMSPYPKEWSYMVQKTKAGWHNDECWYPEKCEILMDGTVIRYDDEWSYKVEPVGSTADYSSINYDDSQWLRGPGAFGNADLTSSGLYIGTYVSPGVGRSIWLRRTVNLSAVTVVDVYHDDGAWLWANGVPVTLESVSYFNSRASLAAGQYKLALKVTDGVPTGSTNIFAGMQFSQPGAEIQIIGMNPAHILRRLYTDPAIGRGLGPERLDEESWVKAADQFYTEGFGLCMKWARSTPLKQFIAEVINHAGAVVYTSRRTGKIVLKAIRDDYDINDLPLFTPDTGLLSIDEDEAAALTTTGNELTVNYTNVLDKRGAAVREKNMGAILASGGVINSEDADYPGVPTEALARRLARRDLRAKTGIKRIKLVLDRRGREIMPGHVFRISHPARGIDNMVLRAGQVEFGRTVTITALQDSFGLPATVYRAPSDNGYITPDTIPYIPDIQVAMEAPYRTLAQYLSETDLGALHPTSGYLVAYAVRPEGMAQSFELQTRVAPAAFALAEDQGAWCPGGTLATAVGYMDNTAVLANAKDLDQVQPGTAALIGTEIVRVDALDAATATLTIARGCADTVPAQHTAGTAVLCFDGFGAAATVEYTDSVTVESKLLTSTSSGQLDVGLAPTLPVAFSGRAARPYPPANVMLNGMRYPSEISGDLELTWDHRDRLLQSDALIDALQASIGPEPGTSYTVELYDSANDTLLYSTAGIEDANVVVLADDIAAPAVRLELYSVASGRESAQRFVHTFMTASAPHDPFWSNVVALLHFDGPDGSTTFTDETEKVWARAGSVEIDTSHPKFGAGAGLFSGGYLHCTGGADFSFGTDAFTLEFFLRGTQLGAPTPAPTYFDNRFGAYGSDLVLYTPNGANYMVFFAAGANRIITASISNGEFHHIALCRGSGVTRLFVNGVQSGADYVDTNNYTSSSFRLGANLAGGSGLAGHLDEFRITKGVARYINDFTPLSAPFPTA